jgi:peptide/nickel transport system substrate-binding protein
MLVLLAAAAAVALMTAGSVAGKTSNHPNGGTLVFAGASDPVVLDPAVVSDGETLRVVRQIYEGLMTVKAGTSSVIPQLATKYKVSKNGLNWTFDLRRGVRFHDGTQFNAAAVCYNFTRWFNFRGPFQLGNASYYWQSIFGGFRVNEPGSPPNRLYKGCKANNRYRVTILLNQRSGSFLGALALPSFSIASPTALRRWGADEARVENGSFRATGSYGFQHPTGTGPYRFGSWSTGNRLEIVRYNGYWGPKAHLNRIIFRPVSNNAARLQALQTGEVQGYDLVAPEDMGTIRGNRNLKLQDRPAFNVAYVGINSSKPPMNNKLVRQAVAYGLDRQSVVNSFYAGRGQVAHEFMPPSLFGYEPNVTKYTYNPTRSQQLLRQAGLTLPVEIEFWYPTNVSRPYMPDPRRNFEAFAASLERAGFRVTARSAPWNPTYLGAAQTGNAGHLHLLGWTGDYGDPDNFLGTFFQAFSEQWGFREQPIFDILNRAERETSQARRIALYKQANKLIMDFLPGVPYAHTKPALGFQSRVRGYIPSPVSLEPFRLVSFGGA